MSPRTSPSKTGFFGRAAICSPSYVLDRSNAPLAELPQSANYGHMPRQLRFPLSGHSIALGLKPLWHGRSPAHDRHSARTPTNRFTSNESESLQSSGLETRNAKR